MRNKIIPVANLRDFSWDKQQRRLYGYSEYFAGAFPAELKILSHHTGKAVTFVPVNQNHREFDPDGWDGEMMLYESKDNTGLTLLLTHAY